MDLDELERLLREATAGPWISDDGIVTSDTREICKDPPFIRGGACLMVAAGGLRDRDANLIAALRNAAEELIRDARRMEWQEANATTVDAIGDPDNFVRIWYSPGEKQASGPTIREAIDAAIAQEGKG